MKPILLLVLKVASASGPTPERAEIEKAAVGKQPRRVRLLVDGRAAHLLQAEPGEEFRLRQHLACALIGDGHHERVGHPESWMLRARNPPSPVRAVRDPGIVV